jgi:hypothetical protein
MSETKANHAVHRTAAPHFSFGAAGFSDAGFAASLRSRGPSVTLIVRRSIYGMHLLPP